MGRWRQETDLYGARERWIPDFRGEWPADDGHLPGVLEGNLPNPCPVCAGELTRRIVSPDSHRLARERAKQARLTEALVEAGKDAPTFGPPPTPTRQRLYGIACYRGIHGFSHTEARGGKPTAVGELVPAGRTGDWSTRGAVD